jgi:uncharacterized alkaline shock family protein YloU
VSTPIPDPTPVGQPPGDPDLLAGAVDSGAGPVPATVVVVPVAVPVEVPVPVAVTAVMPAAPADGSGGEVVDAVARTADDVAALVLGVPGVVRLHAGVFGEAATYLPGRRVSGIKLGDDLIEVHVVVANGAPIREIAQQIHTVVAAAVAAPVHVFVEDVDAA